LQRRHFDEMRAADGEVRAHFRAVADWLAETPAERVAEKRREADLLFHRVGITFAVYGDAHGADEGAERLIPFDTIPRVIPRIEWDELARGLRQRVTALNRFLHDIYHGQEILKADVIPAEQVLTNEAYQVSMLGLDLPHGIYSHVSGIDLIRHEDGRYYVLEDNLRTPSGVSYMLENRKMMMRLFPELFARQHVHPVEHYPGLLLETLRAVAPPAARDPVVAVLTPGQHNSAYFEHAFLAQQMGVELVEGGDLFVVDGFVHMRTTSGPQRVDVIYRRIDDAFLDPLAFRQDSLLGVPGLLSVYRAGNVALAYSLPDDGRFIVSGLEIEYVKKARGTITAIGESPVNGLRGPPASDGRVPRPRSSSSAPRCSRSASRGSTRRPSFWISSQACTGYSVRQRSR